MRPDLGTFGTRQVLDEGLGLGRLGEHHRHVAGSLDGAGVGAVGGRRREREEAVAGCLARIGGARAARGRARHGAVGAGVRCDLGDHEVRLDHHRRLGRRDGLGEDLVDAVGVELAERPGCAAEEEGRLAHDLSHGGERVGHRGVGPRDVVGRELVVVSSACCLEVHVLPEVGDRPADVGAEGEGGDAGGLQLTCVRDELFPGRRRRGETGGGELRRVVPDRVLVGRLEPHAVEGAIVARQSVPSAAVVGGQAAEDARERLDLALACQRVQLTGVRDQGDVRRRPAGDRRVEGRIHVAALARVVDGDPGLVLEGGHGRQEVLLLGARPLRPHRDGAADLRRRGRGRHGRRGRRGRRAASGCPQGQQSRRCGEEAHTWQVFHQVSPPLLGTSVPPVARAFTSTWHRTFPCPPSLLAERVESPIPRRGDVRTHAPRASINPHTARDGDDRKHTGDAGCALRRDR